MEYIVAGRRGRRPCVGAGASGMGGGGGKMLALVRHLNFLAGTTTDSSLVVGDTVLAPCRQRKKLLAGSAKLLAASASPQTLFAAG